MKLQWIAALGLMVMVMSSFRLDIRITGSGQLIDAN